MTPFLRCPDKVAGNKRVRYIKLYGQCVVHHCGCSACCVCLAALKVDTWSIDPTARGPPTLQLLCPFDRLQGTNFRVWFMKKGREKNSKIRLLRAKLAITVKNVCSARDSLRTVHHHRRCVFLISTFFFFISISKIIVCTKINYSRVLYTFLKK